jgi:hypothetical protein
MRRREFITLISGGGAWALEPHDSTAQSSDRTRRIALLSGLAATDPETHGRGRLLRDV